MQMNPHLKLLWVIVDFDDILIQKFDQLVVYDTYISASLKLSCKLWVIVDCDDF